MKSFVRKKHIIRKHLIPLLAVSLSFYFAYHLMQGQRSYPRYIALQNQIHEMTDNHADLAKVRFDLEHKVIKMRPDSLDADLVVEQARQVLGYRFDNEMDYILVR